MKIILIIIAIELGIRILPLLDSLVELANHFIAIGVQKCDSKIRKIALETAKEEEELEPKTNALPQIGFCIEDEPTPKEKDDFE